MGAVSDWVNMGDALGGQHEVERLSRALSGYGDRVLIAV